MEQQIMIIRQSYFSSSISFFQKKFIRKFNLTLYSNPKKPALFFGCYPNSKNINAIKNHKSLGVIIWRGTDALNIKKNIVPILRRPNIRHVAISSYIEKDLIRWRLPYKFIPISSINTNSFDTCPLGDSIYIYSSHGNPKFYGMDIVKRIEEEVGKMGVRCIVGYARGENSVPHNRISDIYKKCFLGLRLTKHDGLSNTVLELGLMGRRCIWNGGIPTSIPWVDDRSILNGIRDNLSFINTIQDGVSESIKKYLDIGTEWMTTEYWNYG